MPELEIEMIEPRKPSVEYIREMIEDADKQFQEWSEDPDPTPKDINNQYYWIRQQLLDLIVVNKMLKKLEEPF